jgi:hypothetical protein
MQAAGQVMGQARGRDLRQITPVIFFNDCEEWADNGFSLKNQDACRGRFIAPTADLSALAELSDIRINLLKLIIGGGRDNGF